MKKLFSAFLLMGVIFTSCGPSSESGTNTDTGTSTSPTGDTAITDDGTGAAKGAETAPDSTRVDTTTNQ